MFVTESGIGAGIDSYYEYLLKGYIMLGKDTYLERFNKVWHFEIMSKGSSFIHLFIQDISIAPLLLKSTPDYSIDTVSELTCQCATGNYE